MAGRPKQSGVLPRDGDYPVLRGPLAPLILRPYFDRISLYIVTRWYMKLSRAWAAALEAEGSVDGFMAAFGGDVSQRPWMGSALSAVRERNAAYRAAADEWEEGFFGPTPLANDALVGLEMRRHGEAHRLMSTRARFLRVRNAASPVKFEIAPREEVEARHGHRLAGGQSAFPPPPPAEVDVSQEVRGPYGNVSWLRFPSPSPHMGDTAWARVDEPERAVDPPTLIFLHGICMEPEMWLGMVDGVTPIARRGVRVIRPEGPWHGRRVPAGAYGGEPAIGRGPMGLIDLFEAWVAEVGVLIDWARQTSRGPVAIGGLSLGALTSQLAATAALRWPGRLQPDAKILIVTSGDLLATAHGGALPMAVGLPSRLAASGWAEADLSRWLPLMEPGEKSAVPADRTVMLLGRVDEVTPYAGGQSLVQRWNVPPGNLFVHNGGHFSTPLTLYRNTRPLDRLLELLG